MASGNNHSAARSAHSLSPDDRAAVLQELDGLKARMVELERLVSRDPAADDAMQAAVWQPCWISMAVAVSEFRLNAHQIKYRCIKHGLGHKRGGQWDIDQKRFQAWQDRQPYPKLTCR